MEEYPYRRAPSPIHGTGVFATKLLRAGTMLKMPDTLTKEWTGFGGFNHSCNHNIGKLAFGGTEHRKVLRDIRRGEEITVNYGIGKHPGCNCESCRESRGMK